VALAELFEAQFDGSASVVWLQRAAESAPSPARRGAVLYRLGVELERLGERRRAIEVLRELMTLAPNFRDVSARVARLEATGEGGASSSR
jgi:hypothetical protein